MKKGFLYLSLSVVLLSCTKEASDETDHRLQSALFQASGGKGMGHFIFPSSTDYASIPADPRNPINFYKVELGKFLFHETGLALNAKQGSSIKTYSCASCHHQAAGFQACLAQGIGDGGSGFGLRGEKRTSNPGYPLADLDIQPLRSPSALNIAFQTNILWNGQFGATGVNIGTQANWTAGTPKEKNFLGYEGIETQAIAGQEVHRLKIDTAFFQNQTLYKTLFDKAYPDMPPGQRISPITVGLAIAAYERTLFANEAPFQLWLKGNSQAMGKDEKEGALLFFGKAQCYKCHSGPALNKMDFYALGMNDLGTGNYGTVFNASSIVDKPDHKGRGGFTNLAEDMYKFKVPQLYNLKDSPFYGHGATFNTISAVIQYKNKAVKENTKVPDSQLSAEFHPLGLSDDEVRLISLFIEKSLYDPNLKRYIPVALPSGLCFPNNDPRSKADMGCQ